jgi:hypothetical protein
VVTEQHGPLAGRRVVRGREQECLVRYGLMAGDRRSARPSAPSRTARAGDDATVA